MRRVVLAVAVSLGLSGPAPADDARLWRGLAAERDAYRQALGAVRAARGGAYALPAVDFFLFGPGRVVLPAFQGSFNMAYPANAPFPDQL